MENYKICVYAICKNESKFIDRWLDSVSEADYVVVLDTGSTDNSYDILKNDKRVTVAKQAVFNPWRFDSARNMSLALAPSGTDIFVCVDLDEILHKGWADVLRASWKPSTIQAEYNYIWSHDGDKPGRVFSTNKIHSTGWYWKYPVHETLMTDIYSHDDIINNTLYLGNNLIIEHFPDETKSRGSYLPLLELRVSLYPEDNVGKLYLGHEYYYKGHYEKSIEVLKNLYTNHGNSFNNLERASILLFIGDNYRSLNETSKAIYYYNMSITEEHGYIEPYLQLAEIYNEMGLYHLSIGYITAANLSCRRFYSWLERDDSFTSKPHDILSIAYYYVGNIKESLNEINMAIEIDTENERFKLNKKLIEEAMEDNSNA